MTHHGDTETRRKPQPFAADRRRSAQMAVYLGTSAQICGNRFLLCAAAALASACWINIQLLKTISRNKRVPPGKQSIPVQPVHQFALIRGSPALLYPRSSAHIRGSLSRISTRVPASGVGAIPRPAQNPPGSRSSPPVAGSTPASSRASHPAIHPSPHELHA